MGIKQLNRFLLDNCSKNAIKKTHLSKLDGKTIAIDISIYIYKFMSENQLLEKMYLLITMLKHYNIDAIYVFDGKAPNEKKELIEKRRIEKIEAKNKYFELMDQLKDNPNIEKSIIEEIRCEMDILKRRFITVNETILAKIKELLNSCGARYVESPAEADTYCAYLMNSNQVWGCLSDDMDMFLYGGSSRILRNLSLHNHTIFCYHQPTILFELDMDEQIFRDIMVLSGTDYNINTETSLHETIKWYYQYKMYIKKNDDKIDFYKWLHENTRYIKDFPNLTHVKQMFILDDSLYKSYGNIDNNKACTMDVGKMQCIMEEEGFYFV